MRKLLILLSFSLIIIGCASIPQYDENGFCYEESETSNDIIIKHRSTKYTDSPCFYIYGDRLWLRARYIASDWLFINQINFMDNKNKDNKLRISVSNNQTVRSSSYSVYIQESLSALLNDSASNLLKFFKETESISYYYIGSKNRSYLYKLDDKLKEGYILTLEKYLSLQK